MDSDESNFKKNLKQAAEVKRKYEIYDKLSISLMVIGVVLLIIGIIINTMIVFFVMEIICIFLMLSALVFQRLSIKAELSL